MIPAHRRNRADALSQPRKEKKVNEVSSRSGLWSASSSSGSFSQIWGGSEDVFDRVNASVGTIDAALLLNLELLKTLSRFCG
jgi:hypothetical protein